MADVQTELTTLENKLQAQLDSAHRVRNTNIILGIILIVLIAGYFQFMKMKLVPFAQPKEIASVASGTVSKHIGKVSEYVDQQARTQVPGMIDNAITHVVKVSIPDGRQRLETEIKARLEETVVKSENAIVDAFESTLKEHGKELPDLVKNLQTAEGKEAFEEDLFKILEDAVKDEHMAAQIDHYGTALADVDNMLKTYADPASEKTPDQHIVAEMIAMMREISNRASRSGGMNIMSELKMGLGGDDNSAVTGTGTDSSPEPAAAAKKDTAPKAAAAPKADAAPKATTAPKPDAADVSDKDTAK